MAISVDEQRVGAPSHAPRAREIFWNLPNTITMLRTSVVPVLLLLPVFSPEPAAERELAGDLEKLGSQVIAWCFIIAALTDIVDGWLARRGQQVTRIVKLLDPLADKLLVSTALVVLVAMGRIPMWGVWMVVVIVGRELAVTGLRSLASAGGQVMGASWLGKVKTVAQNVAISALIFHYPTFGLPAREIGLAMLTLATLLTLGSGYLYFAQYFGGLNSDTPSSGSGT